MGLFDRFKKQPPAPPPTKAEDMEHILMRNGADWEYYRYDPQTGIAAYMNSNQGDGRQEDYDFTKPEDIPFELWPFINNDSTEVVDLKEAFPYLI